jgi:hypothetical protein
VDALAPNDAWVVGEYYTGSTWRTLTLHWDGVAWSVIPSPNVGTSRNNLLGVVAVASNDVWAVGGYEASGGLALHWNGTTWGVAPSPDVGSGTTSLYGVATQAGVSGYVWAVGSNSGSPSRTVTQLYSDPCSTTPPGPTPSSGEQSRTFPETGKTVKGLFLEYWEQHGGLAQQGFPISDEFVEQSDLDGKTYTVQYFERAVFEHHPENNPPYDVLLSQLGTFQYQSKYPNGAPNQDPNTDPDSQLFPETGKRVGGKFLEYWRNQGGLAQQGFPISDEFQEQSTLDGKTYTVQYFERAGFEYHPENAGTPYDVLLSQLGTFRYREKYGQP